MSLNKNKKILKIRKKLDILDSKMLNIIKIRTNLVHQVLRNKTSKKQAGWTQDSGQKGGQQDLTWLLD